MIGKNDALKTTTAGPGAQDDETLLWLASGKIKSILSPIQPHQILPFSSYSSN